MGLDPKTTTPPNIVKNVNEATPHHKGAVAAKVLPKSGDTIITFKEEEWEWYANETNEAWVLSALGPDAKIKRRTFAVLAKGIKPELLADYESE